MFKVKFKTTTRAFDEKPLAEIAKMLEQAAEKVRAGHHEGVLRDSQDNIVGKFGWNKD